MAIVEVKVPQLSESVAEVTLLPRVPACQDRFVRIGLPLAVWLLYPLGVWGGFPLSAPEHFLA
jgi:hypothetical protein